MSPLIIKTHVHTYTHTYTHIHTHTYTHTQICLDLNIHLFVFILINSTFVSHISKTITQKFISGCASYSRTENQKDTYHHTD